MYELINSKDAVQGDFGHFGLNEGCLTKFEYELNTEKNYEALNVGITVGTTEITQRYFKPAKLYGKNNTELTVGTEEYKTALVAAEKITSSIICHFAEAFMTKEALAQLFQTGLITDFKSFVTLIEQAIKKTSNWEQKPLQIFLQYQGKPNDNGKTYLEIPKNLKQGLFIVPKQEGSWTEDKTATHLRYVNEKGVIHPISRGKWFMEHANANPVEFKATEEVVLPTTDVDWGPVV